MRIVEKLEYIEYKDWIESPFINTYGGLSITTYEGNSYLRMEDCTGSDYYGPLTETQVKAFHELQEVKKIE